MCHWYVVDSRQLSFHKPTPTIFVARTLERLKRWTIRPPTRAQSTKVVRNAGFAVKYYLKRSFKGETIKVWRSKVRRSSWFGGSARQIMALGVEKSTRRSFTQALLTQIRLESCASKPKSEILFTSRATSSPAQKLCCNRNFSFLVCDNREKHTLNLLAECPQLLPTSTKTYTQMQIYCGHAAVSKLWAPTTEFNLKIHFK